MQWIPENQDPYTQISSSSYFSVKKIYHKISMHKTRVHLIIKPIKVMRFLVIQHHTGQLKSASADTLAKAPNSFLASESK